MLFRSQVGQLEQLGEGAGIQQEASRRDLDRHVGIGVARRAAGTNRSRATVFITWCRRTSVTSLVRTWVSTMLKRWTV